MVLHTRDATANALRLAGVRNSPLRVRPAVVRPLVAPHRPTGDGEAEGDTSSPAGGLVR